jgi:methyl acetate hydrolase
MKNELDRVLAAGIARGAAPGVTAIVVDRDGVLYEGGFGKRSIDGNTEMTTDTVGKIFSMTKALTGAAAMQLVERGKLNLDAPAGDVCPELAAVEVLTGFDEAGAPLTRAPATPVTLRQLLTHTAGFGYNVWNADLGRWHAATETPTLASQQRASLLQPLTFDPGSRWQYGIGIDWAGQMVEAVSGMRLGEYFTRELTGPLCMTDTAFDYSASMFERAAALHIRAADGSFTPMPLESTDKREFDGGGDGLRGTMSDYGRFLRVMLNDGELDGARVLQAKTVEQMCSNQIGKLRVEKMSSCIPALSNDGEFFPGDEKSWGLTFQINEQPGFTGRPAGTLMWAGLANSYYWIDRHNGVAGAYMSQILPFADAGSLGLFFEMESAVYKHLA